MNKIYNIFKNNFLRIGTINGKIGQFGQYNFTNNKYSCKCCSSCNKFFNCDKVIIAFLSGALVGSFFTKIYKKK